MSTSRRFKQIDVFSAQPCRGNPLAVVFDSTGLDDATMQQLASWLNLSETTFLLPPTTLEADYRVRIFTTSAELPFAGHPTLGSCHAWMEAGGQPRGDDRIITQECAKGLIRIQSANGRLAFAAPPLSRAEPLAEQVIAKVAQGLGISRDDIVDHQLLVNGPVWTTLLLKSAEQVLSLRPDPAALTEFDIGLVGPYPEGSPCAFEVRGLPYSHQLFEDPVTGSLNAAIAQWLVPSGVAPTNYTASQGAVIGRSGLIYVSQDATGQIWIGGNSRTLVDGSLTFD
jgi:PhzF family phenazine biosynthesis protein